MESLNKYNDDRNSYSLNLNDMWKLATKEESNLYGVPGYQVPKKYIDPIKQKFNREAEELNESVWKGKEHYPSPRLQKDANGKEILPKRPNFIDDLNKFNKANFSPKKFDDYKEKLQSKGLTLEELEGTKKSKTIQEKIPDVNSSFFKVDRRTYIDDILRYEKKKNQMSPELKEMISKVNDKHQKYTSPELKDTENKARMFNSKISKEMQRNSYLSDFEYLGESIPFYNSSQKKTNDEEEDSERNGKTKTKENLFFPSKDAVLTSSPKWSMHNPVNIVRRQDENFKKKIEDTKNKWESRRIKFIDDVSLAYFNVNEGKKGTFKYHKESQKNEVYYQAKNLSPDKHPGPQQYWQSPRINDNANKRLSKDQQEDDKDDSGTRKYFMNREKTDSIIYKPMKKYVF